MSWYVVVGSNIQDLEGGGKGTKEKKKRRRRRRKSLRRSRDKRKSEGKYKFYLNFSWKLLKNQSSLLNNLFLFRNRYCADRWVFFQTSLLALKKLGVAGGILNFWLWVRRGFLSLSLSSPLFRLRIFEGWLISMGGGEHRRRRSAYISHPPRF